MIYFHLPDEVKTPLVVDVQVAWRGGWLTQFYPDAKSEAPGAFRVLDEGTLGRLAWLNLTVGRDASGPLTTEHVWTAPRAVKASPVTTASGESEKYLFYRGVGHLNAPVRVARLNDRLDLLGDLDAGFTMPLRIQRLWLAQFRSDGGCAFRSLNGVTLRNESLLLSTDARFASREFSAANLTGLRGQMHRALVADGLFDEEADALLNTLFPGTSGR